MKTTTKTRLTNISTFINNAVFRIAISTNPMKSYLLIASILFDDFYFLATGIV